MSRTIYSLNSYTGGATALTLAGSGIGASDTTLTLSGVSTSWSPLGSTGGWYLAVGYGATGEEKIYVPSGSWTYGNSSVTFTGVTRGVDYTTPVAHASGVTCVPVLTSTDISEANYAVNNLYTIPSASGTAGSLFMSYGNLANGTPEWVPFNVHQNVQVVATTNISGTYVVGNPGTSAGNNTNDYPLWVDTLTVSGNGTITIDGHTVQQNDRVLLVGQSINTQNGVWLCTTSGSASTTEVFCRDNDVDLPSKLQASIIQVNFGTNYGGTAWWTNLGYGQTTALPSAFGTTPVNFYQLISSAGGFINGNVLISGSISSTTPAASGILAIGGAMNYSDVNNLATFTSSVNNYNQVVAQNTNAGATASTSFNISNNLATSGTYYAEFGMNSSGYTGAGVFNAPNATYLAAASGELGIGTYAGGGIHLVVSGNTFDSLVVSGNNTIGINAPVTIFSGSNYYGTSTFNNGVVYQTTSPIAGGPVSSPVTISGTVNILSPGLTTLYYQLPSTASFSVGQIIYCYNSLAYGASAGPAYLTASGSQTIDGTTQTITIPDQSSWIGVVTSGGAAGTWATLKNSWLPTISGSNNALLVGNSTGTVASWSTSLPSLAVTSNLTITGTNSYLSVYSGSINPSVTVPPTYLAPYKAWTVDPVLATSTVTLITGTAYYTSIWIPQPMTISGVSFFSSTFAATDTAFLGLFNSTTQLASFTGFAGGTTGLNKALISGGNYTITTPGLYYIGLVVSGSTSFVCYGPPAGQSALVNLGIGSQTNSVTGLRSGSVVIGQRQLYTPSTTISGTVAANTLIPWFALS